jgi:hypothetical protein
MLKAQPAAAWKLATWRGACRGAKATCSVRMTNPTRAAATFVPPGARANPIPVGKTADSGDG